MTVKSSQDNSIEKIETISATSATIAESLKLTLVQARFTQQGKRRILEITVHKPLSRVSLEDCEKLSRELEQHFGELSDTYELQVQSPGIDRKLVSARELTVFKGELVEVKSKLPLPGLGTTFTGRLLSYCPDADASITVSAPKIMVLPGKTVKKGSSKKKKDESFSLVEPPEQITLTVKSLDYVRLNPNTTE